MLLTMHYQMSIAVLANIHGKTNVQFLKLQDVPIQHPGLIDIIKTSIIEEMMMITILL